MNKNQEMSMLITKAVFSTAVLLAVALQVTPARAAPDAYAAEVMADNPIGYWRLNETSGTTATDSSGNGYDGTYYDMIGRLGQPGLPPGVPGDKAALFDGASATAFGLARLREPAFSGPPGLLIRIAHGSAGPILRAASSVILAASLGTSSSTLCVGKLF